MTFSAAWDGTTFGQICGILLLQQFVGFTGGVPLRVNYTSGGALGNAHANLSQREVPHEERRSKMVVKHRLSARWDHGVHKQTQDIWGGVGGVVTLSGRGIQLVSGWAARVEGGGVSC